MSDKYSDVVNPCGPYGFLGKSNDNEVAELDDALFRAKKEIALKDAMIEELICELRMLLYCPECPLLNGCAADFNEQNECSERWTQYAEAQARKRLEEEAGGPK